MSESRVSLSWEVNGVNELSLLIKKTYNVSYLLFVAEVFCKFLCGASTVTDGILRLCTHLCEGHAVGFEGSKDRVVPEAFIPYALP